MSLSVFVAVALVLTFTFALSQAAAEPPATQPGVAAAAEALRASLGDDLNLALRLRVEQVNRDIATNGILPFAESTDKLLTGYAYHEFYDWDLYFENLYLSHFGQSAYCFTNLRMFLDRQQDDGFISRTLRHPRTRQMFKPFLAQIAVLGSTQRNDYQWLRGRYYQRLGKYLDRWFKYDSDGNGLPVWNSADHSGMDNQVSRAGKMDAFEVEGVDLACYLVRELRAMAVIAQQLGLDADRAAFEQRAGKLADTINAVMWDDRDGFYYDRNEKTGQTVRVKSVAGFIPLWAGVASPQQARRLVDEHLHNPAEFWLAYPVACYARTEPDYYQGEGRGNCNWRGTTWVPTNYMIMHGLVRYGYRDLARELAYKTCRMALVENDTTREYYNGETGKGLGLNPFWGWSALAYVMPLELEMGYDPTEIGDPIRPATSEAMSIKWPQ